MTITEAQLQAQIIDLALIHKWLVFHDHDSRRNHPGLPDLILVRDDAWKHPAPWVLFVELKSAKGRLTPVQHEWAAALTSVAERVDQQIQHLVVRPVDFDMLAALLTRRHTPGAPL